ncbi:MAG: EFR1 family ferrodoxin [Bacilli bacterium]|jgi:ferredoxin/flavodoxin|nr:EFR1 family ferrodoxin [Bacilli bacterium]
MRCLIFCYSGTGNTSLAASFLKRHFEEKGIQTDLFIYQEPLKEIPDPSAYDLIGIGYPIHAFNVPEVFLRFLKKLPALKESKDYFIFKTSGEPYMWNRSSSYLIDKALKKKGYHLIMEKHLLMPYNIMFRYPDGVVKQMYEYLYALSDVVTKRLALGEKDQVKFPFSRRITSFFFRIEWIAPKVNHPLCHSRKKRCINCGLCISKCPQHAMYKNKKGVIKINNHCSMCMRCTMNCPKDAIFFGFMHAWRVNKPYNFVKLLKDPSVDDHYINPQTKDYFRHFRKYFKEQDEILAKYGIEVKKDF